MPWLHEALQQLQPEVGCGARGRDTVRVRIDEQVLRRSSGRKPNPNPHPHPSQDPLIKPSIGRILHAIVHKLPSNPTPNLSPTPTPIPEPDPDPDP